MQVVPLDAARQEAGSLARAAWLLDATALHSRLADLAPDLDDPAHRAALRDAAAALWDSDEPVVRSYLDGVASATPEEWAAGFERRHLVEWYRVLAAEHVAHCPWPERPRTARVALESVGWHPADARRLSAGRPLAELPHEVGCRHAVRLGSLLGSGRGWLAHGDVTAGLTALRRIPARRFRGHPDAIEPCEALWSGLETAAGSLHDDGDVLLITGS